MRPSHDDDQKYLSGPSTRFSLYKMVLSSPSLLLLKLIFHDEIGRYLVLGYAAESTVLTGTGQVLSFFTLFIISETIQCEGQLSRCVFACPAIGIVKWKR